MRLILASGSPRRKELLELVGMKFEVITSNAKENTDETMPGQIVMDLSKLKADAVFKILKNENINEDYAVIGADTIVWFDGKVYGKPENKQKAYDMLKSLSGNTHQVYTGVTVLCSDGRVNSFYEKTDVKFKEISDEEIYKYIETGDPMDKAGAYGIQGPFTVYVEGINGDYNNVVGLPVSRLYQEMKKMKGIL